MGMTLSALPTAPGPPRGKPGAGRGDRARSQFPLLSIQLRAKGLRNGLWVVGTPGQGNSPVLSPLELHPPLCRTGQGGVAPLGPSDSLLAWLFFMK